MTPKEKAEELIFNFSIVETSHFNENMDGKITMEQIGYYSAKQCALIAVNEIIKTLPQSEYLEDRSEMIENRELIYWQEVKQEIENL